MKNISAFGGTLVGILLILSTASSVVAEDGGEWELSGSIGAELRYFYQDPAFAEQFEDFQSSFLLSPRLSWESGDRKNQVSVLPFLRLDDQDEERSHFDLREAYWRFVADDWELLAGVNTLFWGVTESRHLVDVINQIDSVEDIDEEDRLGQPMVQFSVQRDWGRLEAFALLGFRERTFPGIDGRLRPPFPVDTDEAEYESGAERSRIDLALRYSHFLGDWDFAVYGFSGTGREPRLLPAPAGDTLIPFYDVVNQFGAEVQYTREAWLWKLEAMGREGQGSTFGAAVGGFEYTFFQVGGTAADVGVLLEYLYDGRDETAPVVASQDDIFVGARWALNDIQDTQLLAGAIVDRVDRSTAALIEAERRLGSHFRLEFEARLFFNVAQENPLSYFEQDSFLTTRLSYFF